MSARHWGNGPKPSDDSNDLFDLEDDYEEDDEYDEDDESYAAEDYLSSRPWGYDNNGY